MAHNSSIFEGFIFRSRERTHRFCQQLEFMDVKGGFASLRPEHHATSLDEITDIEHLVEEVQSLLTDFVQTEEKLKPAGSVFDMGKGNFSHGASSTNAPRSNDFY